MKLRSLTGGRVSVAATWGALGALVPAILCAVIGAGAQVPTIYEYRTSTPAMVTGTFGERAASHTLAVARVTRGDSAGAITIRIDVGPTVQDRGRVDLVVTPGRQAETLPDPDAPAVLYDIISMGSHGQISYGAGSSPNPMMRPVTGRQPRLALVEYLPGFGLLAIAPYLPTRRGESRVDILVRRFTQIPFTALSADVRQTGTPGAQMIDTLMVQWRRDSVDTVTGTIYRSQTRLADSGKRNSYTRGSHLVVFDRDGAVREATTTLNWDPAPLPIPGAKRPPMQTKTYSLVKLGG